MSEEKERYRILHYFDGLYIVMVCLNEKALERVMQIKKGAYDWGNVIYIHQDIEIITPK